MPFYPLHNMKKTLLLLTCIFTLSLSAQERIRFHTESIDSLFSWLKRGNPQNEINALSKVPANQIMEQLFLSNQKNTQSFAHVLNKFVQHEQDSTDLYLLKSAFKLKNDITALIRKVTNPSYSDKLYNYVLEYFPKNYVLTSPIDVYFTATGWEWGDAIVFSYEKDGDRYMVNQGNNQAIIFNATIICSTYGKTLDERVKTLERVFSHETFHFMLHQLMETEGNSIFFSTDIMDKTLSYLFDEGIAHYVADHEFIKKRYTSSDEMKEIEQRNRIQFAEKAQIIFNPTDSLEVREEALEEGLYGKYWDKYVCITGLFMAYHIEQHGGLDALKRCIVNGPLEFIREYNRIQQSHNDLPVLPEEIITYLRQRG